MTVRLPPASAVGARFTFRTVIVTWSVALRLPSLTVSRNVSDVLLVTSGAVNVGVAVSEPLKVTDGPDVRVHE